MKQNPMRVYLIGKTALDWDQMNEWVSSLGGQAWLDRIDYERDTYGSPDATDPELLAEAAGRRCYQSWAPGINPNVTKVREDSVDYLRNIVQVNHGSVLEHVTFNFALEGISRVVTHELVRHRVGTAISQESLRYVRLTDIPINLPDFVLEDDVLGEEASSLIQAMEAFQELVSERLDIDNMTNFHEKKQITSAMRRFAPIGLSTGMVWSANIRTLRQTIKARTDEGAEVEIRELFNAIGEIMLEEAPALFSDFVKVQVRGSDIPAWVPKRDMP